MSSPEKNLAYWQAHAQALQIESRAFIDGHYTPAQTEETFECRSPIDGELLCEVAQCGQADVDLAVAAGRRSFEAGVWAGLHPRQRKKVLRKFAELIRLHNDELALLESLDMGKPINDATRGDVPGAAQCIEWYAEAIDKWPGEVAPCDHNVLGLITREPVGVVACVVPWNFPILMASWKIAPALATGNSVILKPSEKSPLTAIRLAGLARDAGIPAGVFNVLTGDGRVGEALALHGDVDCIAFTGSTAVGKRIMQCAGQSNLKRVWLELGGKSANIVLADCPDLDRAAQAAAGAICYNMGEMCTAGSRLLVQRAIKDQFVERVRAEMATWQPAHPLDPATGMGAIVDDIQLKRVLGYIEAGKQEGATLVLGGQQTRADTGGYYVEPTIFQVSDPNIRIAREEIFGPVLSIIEFDTLDEAIAIANRSDYGLGAAIWTADLVTAHTAARRLRAGTVWVNCYEEGSDMNFPFGGYKQSGNGRDKSLHAMEKYTELKSTVVKLG